MILCLPPILLCKPAQMMPYCSPFPAYDTMLIAWFSHYMAMMPDSSPF